MERARCAPNSGQKTVDLPYQVINPHHLVEIKGVKELALTALLPT
jgi:hypothetical protein